MTDSELLTRWSIGLALALIVVVVVAVLLVLILDAARGVLAAASRSLTAVQKIRANVEPLWDLATTNQVAEELVQTARHIEGTTGVLADVLEQHQMTPTATRS